MLKYIIRDMWAAMRFLPFGLIAAGFSAIGFRCINRERVRRGKRSFSVLAVSSLFMYVAVLLCMTFMERESGGEKGIDLTLWSTWRINLRNKAYVIENVLLFLPYGLVLPWNFKAMRSFFLCTLTGLATSFFIECMQFLTQRGFFQIDDILTNLLGTVAGFLLYRIFFRRRVRQ